MNADSKNLSNPTRGIARWLVRETVGIVMVAVILSLSAGRLDWAMGWALVVRTAPEDQTLQAELDGYAEYSRRTSYRLLPGVW